MKASLEDDVWTRRGINVLWDGAALARIGPVAAAISLRRFFTLDALGWPEDETPLVDDQALVVAGLDVALDALDPADIEDWIEQVLYPRIQEFQSVFAGHRALIFWMPDKGRWLENSGEGAFEWRLGSGDQGPRLPLARLLWDGAYRDVQRIEEPGDKGVNRWIGLYLARIS
ncbi:MAG: 5'-nucleotidase [Chromatiaceae bacterium]|nr:5'-nucleotidase [Chromatiaceae bacterium]